MKETTATIAILLLACCSAAPSTAAPVLIGVTKAPAPVKNTLTAGISVNGGAAQTGAVQGAASGGDTVTASGTFAGAYSQNPNNANGTETVTVNAGADVTAPSGVATIATSTGRSVSGVNYTDHYFYNALFQINQGSLNNQGIINALFANEAGSTQVFGLDQYVDGIGVPNSPASESYYSVNGIFVRSSQVSLYGPTTIVNGSSTDSTATISGVMTGSGEGFANGIQATQYYGPSSSPSLTVLNYGAISGQVQNHDGTATGINSYSLYGGLSVTNSMAGTCSASAPYYAAGIYGQIYYGNSSAENDGTVTADATGGKQGSTANRAFATGIDLFNYAGNISLTNTGTLTATSEGAATNTCYGAFLFAQGENATGGGMTLTNSGTIEATSSNDTNAAAKAVYCGGVGGPQTVTNSGSIIGTAGPAGGWAMAVEDDASDAVNVVNTGTISHNNGLGVGVFIGSGPAVVRNRGSIYGGLTGISAQTFKGPLTVYDHGPLRCGASGNGAMVLGSGSNNAYFYGLPTVSGTINGGGGGKSLKFHLTGVLQSVDDAPANNGPNLSSYNLGTSGSITVGGKTYAWANFTVAGSTASTGVAGGTYKIINRLSGKALGTHLSLTANNTIVEQFTYGGGSPQRWTVTSLGGGRYEIIGVGSGRALEVENSATGDGSPLDIYDYHGTANQQWVLTPTDSGYYTLTPANVLGSCMDVAGTYPTNLNNLQPMVLETLDDADAASGGMNQQWAFQSP